MKKVAAMVMLAVLPLAACSQNTQDNNLGPAPSETTSAGKGSADSLNEDTANPADASGSRSSGVSSGGSSAGGSAEDGTGGMNNPVRTPVIIGADDAEVFAILGLDVVVVAVDDARAWQAVVTPKAAAQWIAGADEGTYSSNPTLELKQPGTFVLTLTKRDGSIRKHTVHVSDPARELSDTEEESRAFAKTVVGKKEAVAIEMISAKGLVARVVIRDGESFPATMDYSPSRVNLTIVDNIVTEASIG